MASHFFACEIDVAALAQETGGNIEAIGRSERYVAAQQALESLCRHEMVPISEGRIVTAHTQDDRVENFLYALNCRYGSWRVSLDALP